MVATVLVVGANGQVGRALRAASWPADLAPVFLDRRQLDIADARTVCSLCQMHKPAAILNAAAFSHVDKAESDPEGALAANRLGPLNLAIAAEAHGALLLHISTDYVFDGSLRIPYPVDHPLSPLGVYGRSKAAGEQAVAAACRRHLIVRTAWVFSAWAGNFARLVFDRARGGLPLKVVSDQTGSPTPATDLAAACIAMIAQALQDDSSRLFGTHHYVGGPIADRLALAAAVLDEAERQGIARPDVTPVPASTFAAPAPRPAWSVLDMSKTTELFGLPQPDWRPALAEAVQVWAREKETPA
ncbi:dTDP-4-dehydrorhamnose reductase [Lacibacterium aquatile]|uniref:dTDP-4-dehydrorhamnose reductase n=1 Tax=Lacibacterium aquatile TaxID=1168082 RepID=A0ABW5DRW8_9PROT